MRTKPPKVKPEDDALEPRPGWTDSCRRLKTGFAQVVNDVFEDPQSTAAGCDILNVTASLLLKTLARWEPERRRQWIEAFSRDLLPLRQPHA
jgi:hypothetical protein